MTWPVLLPFKGSAERKTRLANRLDASDRAALSLSLFNHAVQVLERCPSIGEIALLSDQPPLQWPHRFLHDRGGGLNAELTAAVGELGNQRLLVLLPDLPLLDVADVEAMLSMDAREPCIAPDRSGTGTNALALVDPKTFNFAFGPNSFKAHVHTRRSRVVKRLGLALDIDTADDLDDAASFGFEYVLTGSANAVEHRSESIV